MSKNFIVLIQGGSKHSNIDILFESSRGAVEFSMGFNTAMKYKMESEGNFVECISPESLEYVNRGGKFANLYNRYTLVSDIKTTRPYALPVDINGKTLSKSIAYRGDLA